MFKNECVYFRKLNIRQMAVLDGADLCGPALFELAENL